MIVPLMDLRTKETYERKMEESNREAERARRYREEADDYRKQARAALGELERIDMLIIDKRREMESAMRRGERCVKMKEEIRREFNNLFVPDLVHRPRGSKVHSNAIIDLLRRCIWINVRSGHNG